MGLESYMFDVRVGVEVEVWVGVGVEMWVGVGLRLVRVRLRYGLGLG